RNVTGVQTCALPISQLTFAMARHALIDLALILEVPPEEAPKPRLQQADVDRINALLSDSGLQLADGSESDDRLAGLRRQYDGYRSEERRVGKEGRSW